MHTRPTDLADDGISNCLLAGWGLDVARLEYVGVGGGSPHWLVHDDAGQRHWVTVDDLDDKSFLGDTSAEAFVALRAAFDTALTLRETGLDFVLAPLRSKRGQTVEPLGARYAAAVYPYLLGTSAQFGAIRSPEERAE